MARRRRYIAEDGVNSTTVFFDEDDAYDDFLETYGYEPLRILDVTDGYAEAIIVWESDE